MPKETSGPTLMKDRISPDVIAHLADLLAAASKSFRRDEFLADAVEGLESMEMKARVLHVADALSRSLPADFPEAAEVIDEALGSPGLNSWMAYPVDDFVARYGIDFPEVALPLMGKLTASSRSGRSSASTRRRHSRSSTTGSKAMTRTCAAWSPKAAARGSRGEVSSPSSSRTRRRRSRCWTAWSTTPPCTCGNRSPTTSTTSPRTTRNWPSRPLDAGWMETRTQSAGTGSSGTACAA